MATKLSQTQINTLDNLTAYGFKQVSFEAKAEIRTFEALLKKEFVVEVTRPGLQLSRTFVLTTLGIEALVEAGELVETPYAEVLAGKIEALRNAIDGLNHNIQQYAAQENMDMVQLCVNALEDIKSELVKLEAEFAALVTPTAELTTSQEIAQQIKTIEQAIDAKDVKISEAIANGSPRYERARLEKYTLQKHLEILEAQLANSISPKVGDTVAIIGVLEDGKSHLQIIEVDGDNVTISVNQTRALITVNKALVKPFVYSAEITLLAKIIGHLEDSAVEAAAGDEEYAAYLLAKYVLILQEIAQATREGKEIEHESWYRVARHTALQVLINDYLQMVRGGNTPPDNTSNASQMTPQQNILLIALTKPSYFLNINGEGVFNGLKVNLNSRTAQSLVDKGLAYWTAQVMGSGILEITETGVQYLIKAGKLTPDTDSSDSEPVMQWMNRPQAIHDGALEIIKQRNNETFDLRAWFDTHIKVYAAFNTGNTYDNRDTAYGRFLRDVSKYAHENFLSLLNEINR